MGQKITSNWMSNKSKSSTLPALHISHSTDDVESKYSMVVSVLGKEQRIESTVKGTYANTSEWRVDATQEQMSLPDGKFAISIAFEKRTDIDSIFVAPPQGFII